MESEERPNKMRKLEHSEHDLTAPSEQNMQASATIVEPNFAGTVHGGSVESNAHAEEPSEIAGEGENSVPKISKNQLKKQRRHERWEAGREDRKLKRKEKIKEKKERRREAITVDEDGNIIKPGPLRLPRGSVGPGKQVPITVIFDCDFEDLMYDHELKSLGLQITRCYSDNRKAKFRTHLALSSFGGKMEERFNGILAQQHTAWKGFQFFEDDFVSVAEKAKEWMSGPKGGEIGGALETDASDTQASEKEPEEGSSEEGEIVYLSSESDNVLTHLKPNSTYIIGGLVDKNRHKGVCHKRAVNRNVKTAKLPIGEYLEMKSRQVLVTNHVLEIMLKWLEFGDWGKAFMAVMPKRKGGRLKDEVGDDVAEDGDEAEEDLAQESGAIADVPTETAMKAEKSAS